MACVDQMLCPDFIHFEMLRSGVLSSVVVYVCQKELV